VTEISQQIDGDSRIVLEYMGIAQGLISREPVRRLQ